jgi:hypothetical protein
MLMSRELMHPRRFEKRKNMLAGETVNRPECSR